MRRILFAAARALSGSSPDDGISDASESVRASEDVVPTGSISDAHLETVAAAPTVPSKQPSSPAARTTTAVRAAAPTPPAASAPLPATPTRRPSSRLPMELRRLGASPDVMASSQVPSSYNLRSRRRVVASTRTDSVAMSRPAFLHKRDVENASTTTLRGVCSRFGIDATGTKEEMRARALAKMAEKTADDFSAKAVGEHNDPVPAAVDGECVDDRANCLTTSTTKKNLASVDDPIVRGAGDVHGKSDVPDADVNMPSAPPQLPLESRPARSWVTDRSAMEKPARQVPPPTPPLTLPRAALPPRGSTSSPIYNPAESVDVSAPLNAGSIFQDWLRTNRPLTAAEYEACVRALRGSVSDGSARRRPSGRAPLGTGALGVAMVPSAIVKRAPTRSATLGLPSPVAASAMRAALPTTPGVRSSTGIPASSRTVVTEVTQRVPQNEASHIEAPGSHQRLNAVPPHPLSNDVTSERNMRGSRHQDLLPRLQQSSHSMPVDTSSTAVRKEAEATRKGEHLLPPKFSGAVGGPHDQNIDRSGVARRPLEDGEKKVVRTLDSDWLERLLGEKFKDVPMKENPQYGDMVPPQQLLKHFNESKPRDSNAGNVVKRTGAKKKRWEHPRETAARIIENGRKRAREWEREVQAIVKARKEEARSNLYQKKQIESETGGELTDVRTALNQKKTRHELAQIRERLERPESPPLPPRAKRALRFLKALREDTSRFQVRERKPDSLPPLPPRLKKVRFKGGFTGASTFFPIDSSSESSVDYERPPDEKILWKRLKRRQLRAERKLKEKKAREQDNGSPTENGVDASKTGTATMLDGNEKQAAEKKRGSDTTNLTPPEAVDGVKRITRSEVPHQARSAPISAQITLESLPRSKLRAPSLYLPNPFKTDSKLSPAGFAAAPTSSSLFGTGKATFQSSEQPSTNGSNENHGKSSGVSLLDASELAKSKPGQIGSETKYDSTSFKPPAPGLFKTPSTLGDTAKAQFDFGNTKERSGQGHEEKPETDRAVWKSGAQRKRKAGDIEVPSDPISEAGKVAANNSNMKPSLFPSHGQRESEVRNASNGARGDIEPSGSNGKTSIPSLPSSSIPALANSQLPPARFGKNLPEEGTLHTAGFSQGKGLAGAQRSGINISAGAENGRDTVEREEQGPETSSFRVAGTPSTVFGKDADATVNPEEGLKQDKPKSTSFHTKPTSPLLKNEETIPPFVFTPSKPFEPSKAAFAPSTERSTGIEPPEKEMKSSLFSSTIAAPSTEQPNSAQPVQKPSSVKLLQEPGNSSFLRENSVSEDGKKLNAPNPPSTKAEEPISFGSANAASKNLFEKPSFGIQVTSGNPFGVKKTETTSGKPSEDVMATADSPADRKDSKPLFGMEGKGTLAQGTSFGGFKPANTTPAPIFASAQTQPPSAPFSFNKSAGIEQKQPGGPFGDSKFSSSFKSIGPASSFVFGASEQSQAPDRSGAAPTPFSAGAPKAQTGQAKPNPFATPSNPSPFSAAPTGFGISSQSQGFSFPGSSSAFGSSNPVDKPSSFVAPNFGSNNAKGFGQGGSKPTFSFGAAGGSAPTFGAPSGNAAPNPFGTPNPSQNAFGTTPFGVQPESQPLPGADSSAPFPQGSLFGGSNNTQSGLSGRANEPPGSNNAFSAQGGQPSGPGAFAMGSTAAPRRKVKARRMLR